MDKGTYIVWWDTDQSEAPTMWLFATLTVEEAGQVYSHLRDNVEKWAQVGVSEVAPDFPDAESLIAALREDYGIGDEEDEE